ncbi:MAG: hypothetical protein AAFR49_00530 [Pseudomonadota bacterium]
MLPDPERYWHHVAHLDMTDARKIDIINTVFQAMQSQVDRAFGDDPVQLAVAASCAKRASHSSDVIDLSKDDYCTSDLSQTFNDKKGTRKL